MKKVYQAIVPNKKEPKRTAVVFIEASSLIEAAKMLDKNEKYIKTVSDGLGEVESISITRDCTLLT